MKLFVVLALSVGFGAASLLDVEVIATPARADQWIDVVSPMGPPPPDDPMPWVSRYCPQACSKAGARWPGNTGALYFRSDGRTLVCECRK